MRLDGRTAGLIAIGASIAANCQPCLEYHARAAREAGADDQALAEKGEGTPGEVPSIGPNWLPEVHERENLTPSDR